MIKPLVSIVTPMYNGEKYLDEMIISVINQTYDHWELLIVDDCSNDKSCEIVEKYIEKDNRIKLIKQEKNSGPSQARNKAIGNAKGKYIAFLDCDDIWKNSKLEIQVNFMEENDALVTCTSYEIASEGLNEVYKEFIVPSIITYKQLLKQNYFSCDTVMIHRKMIKYIKFKNYDKHGDYITWLGLMKNISKAYGINKPLAVYRLRHSSRSSGKLDSAKKIWMVYREYENLSIFKSSYYTVGYIIRGILKYRGTNKINLRNRINNS